MTVIAQFTISAMRLLDAGGQAPNVLPPFAQGQDELLACETVADDGTSMPFERCTVLRSGRDMTLVSWGAQMPFAGKNRRRGALPPQVAILGAGHIVDRPGRAGLANVALHRMLPLSLSFDHRAICGGEAARFLRAVIADLETAT
jgi:hypothetical protein